MTITTLKNNLNVILIPRKTSNICVIGFVTPSGHVVENGAFTEGLIHLLERLRWCGTLKYPTNRQLSSYLELLSCRIHSDISFENTQLFLETPSYNQYKALSLLAEIIQNPLFDSNDIDKQKKNLGDTLFAANKEELTDTYANNHILKTFYLNQLQDTLSYTPLEVFNTLKKEDLVDYISHQFHPSRSFLVIAGNYNEDNILEYAEQDWGYWEPKNKRYIDAQELIEEVKPNYPLIHYRQVGSYYTEIDIGFLIDPKPQSKFYNPQGQLYPENQIKAIQDEYLKFTARLTILNYILGQGMTSRLWTKGIEEQMMFNRINSEIIEMKNCLYLQISSITDNAQFTFGLEVIMEVVNNLKKSTITATELSKVKEMIKGKLVVENEDLLNNTVWLTNNYLNNYNLLDINQLITYIDQVQASEIRSTALDIFTSEKLSIVISGTAKENKIVDKLIYKYLS
jgi:predicted Zn-dependent peptidase